LFFGNQKTLFLTKLNLWRLPLLPSSLHVGLLSLPYVDGHACGEGDVISGIEALQAYLTHADAELVGD
jgi:hypothetical protein